MENVRRNQQCRAIALNADIVAVGLDDKIQPFNFDWKVPMRSRRKFLQTLSAGLVLPAFVTRTQAMKNDTKTGEVLRVAIMGLGSYGTRVAEAMVDCKRARLTSVISGTPAKIERWRSKYNIPEKNCYNYDTFDAIKDNPDIDAVYIITPN